MASCKWGQDGRLVGTHNPKPCVRTHEQVSGAEVSPTVTLLMAAPGLIFNASGQTQLPRAASSSDGANSRTARGMPYDTARVDRSKEDWKGSLRYIESEIQEGRTPTLAGVTAYLHANGSTKVVECGDSYVTLTARKALDYKGVTGS